MIFGSGKSKARKSAAQWLIEEKKDGARAKLVRTLMDSRMSEIGHRVDMMKKSLTAHDYILAGTTQPTQHSRQQGATTANAAGGRPSILEEIQAENERARRRTRAEEAQELKSQAERMFSKKQSLASFVAVPKAKAMFKAKLQGAKARSSTQRQVGWLIG